MLGELIDMHEWLLRKRISALSKFLRNLDNQLRLTPLFEERQKLEKDRFYAQLDLRHAQEKLIAYLDKRGTR